MGSITHQEEETVYGKDDFPYLSNPPLKGLRERRREYNNKTFANV